MLDTVQISQYFRPPTFEVPRAFTRPKLPALRELQSKSRAELEAQARLFERLLADTASSDTKPDDLFEIASLVREKELADETRLRPSIEKLKTSLANEGDQPDQEKWQLLGAALLLIFLGWLSLHRDVREGLLRLAGERQAKSEGVLRAKPAEGEIDWTELSREHIARYPKIRAALAK